DGVPARADGLLRGRPAEQGPGAAARAGAVLELLQPERHRRPLPQLPDRRRAGHRRLDRHCHGRDRPVSRGRRRLAFANLDEVMPDVERLLAGHVTVGLWTLGQVCNHLALAFRLSMDGFPVKSPWLVRRTAGVAIRRLMLWTGRIPEGVKVSNTYL